MTQREVDWTGAYLHAAGRLPMSQAHSMNARKCVHAQKPYTTQAFAHESSKVGRRGKRETGKTEVRKLMERMAAQQQKNISEELKKATYNLLKKLKKCMLCKTVVNYRHYNLKKQNNWWIDNNVISK